MQAVQHVATVCTAQQLPLGGPVWVAQRYAHVKAVKLRFRQGIGAELVIRVLCGNYKKWHRQGTGCALNRDLLFFHRLKQRALGFGAGAVDLVGQQHLGKQRAGMKHKTCRLPLVNRHTG